MKNRSMNLIKTLLCGALMSAAGWTDLAAATAPVDTGDETGLAEVVVTAERRASTIQDTPISISAVSGDQLAATGITRVEDMTRNVPGLSVRSAGPGETEYEARGLASNGGAAPTVGFYLDEIPLSPPALSQSGKVVISPDLYDIERIEVLRGPQGTLYGSGSMGGTVRVITNQPKLGILEGSAQGTGSYTDGGGGNYGGNLMLNFPLADVLALRVVLSDQYRSGWIDNKTVSPFPVNLATTVQGPVQSLPVTNDIRNANNMRMTSGRLALLYKPSDDLSILATAFKQRVNTGGDDLLDGSPSSASPSRVYDAHYEAFPIREGMRDDISIFGLTVKANVDFADLTSATAYWDRHFQQIMDNSEGLYWTNQGSTPLVPIPYRERDPAYQFSQELRLASHEGGKLHWVAGAYYSSLLSIWNEAGRSLQAATAAVPDGSFFSSWNPYTMKQTALFADGSYKMTDHWRLSAGVRWYRYQSQQDEFEWGFDAPSPTPPSGPLTTKAADKGFNPRIDLSYMPTPDFTGYLTAARGFRPGGANEVLPVPPCTPGALSFGSDSVWSYELGEKAKMFNNWLTINSDVYYIKWSGVQQIFTLVCGYQYFDNAGDGRSIGSELEINAKLSNAWSASLSGAWTDSQLNHPNAAYTNFLESLVFNPDGVTHPCNAASTCSVPIMNVVRDTASVSINYSTAVMNNYQLSVRVADDFVGSSHDVAYYFNYTLPSYNLANARVSLARDNWSANLFVDNLTNKVALMTANNTSFVFNIPQLVRYTTNQPRTVGMQVNYKF